MKNKKYVIACMVCGETKNLLQYAHRNKNKNIVGWFYSCPRCTEGLSEMAVKIGLVKKEGEK